MSDTPRADALWDAIREDAKYGHDIRQVWELARQLERERDHFYRLLCDIVASDDMKLGLGFSIYAARTYLAGAPDAAPQVHTGTSKETPAASALVGCPDYQPRMDSDFCWNCGCTRAEHD